MEHNRPGSWCRMCRAATTPPCNPSPSISTARNIGQLNRTRYTNPAYDAALATALEEFDEAKRNAAMAAATRIAMTDYALLLLYWQKLYWAARKGFAVTPDRGESTSVHYVHPTR